jgi:FtsP/CotA-like multicopper oxidase with cupredoxin domain
MTSHRRALEDTMVLVRKDPFPDRRRTARWGLVAAGVLAMAFVAARSGAPFLPRAAADQAPAAALDTLTSPPVLVSRSTLPRTVEVELTAEPARLSLVPGRVNTFYAYNGTVPGPTLEVREGDRVIVHFRNLLPEETTIHWHGLHVPVEADGNPMDPIAPGGSYDYVFDVPLGSAGTYWYHPHPHGHAGQQVSRGLFGAIIVRPGDDPIPAGVKDRLVLLHDIRVNSRGSLIVPSNSAEEQGWEGNVVLVNGQIRPTLEIRPGEVQRWRIVNGSVARYYRLSLEGHTFLHIGSDGGLFERPVERQEILLAPSERVELLVRGTGASGSSALLRSLPYDRYLTGQRPAGWDQPIDVLTARYTTEAPVVPPTVPAVLRVVPPLDPAQATTTRNLILRYALINFRYFSPERVDFTAPLNATEIWSIENRDDMDHPFHLHGYAFQVLDRNGIPEPFLAWEDTVNVPKGQSLRFVVRYENYPGRRMFHCHIMDHEDYGMMGQFEVLPERKE